MLLFCIILIIIIAIIFSSRTKCPNCGSTDIESLPNQDSAAETGLWAILASLINPAGAQSYARRTARTKHYRCRKCGHTF